MSIFVEADGLSLLVDRFAWITEGFISGAPVVNFQWSQKHWVLADADRLHLVVQTGTRQVLHRDSQKTTLQNSLCEGVICPIFALLLARLNSHCEFLNHRFSPNCLEVWPSADMLL